MDAVLAETSIGVTALKKNPLRSSVMPGLKPSWFCITTRLRPILCQRELHHRVASWLADPDQVAEVTRAELEALASAKTRKSPQANSRDERGTCAIKNSIWSARMRRLRRMKSSHRLGT